MIRNLSMCGNQGIVLLCWSRSRSWLEALVLLVIFILPAATLTACGRPFRVPKQVQPVPEKLAARTTVNGLAVEAAAITDEDELIRLFNANMILARVLVVKLTLKNQGDGPVDLHRLAFDLRDVRGHKFKFLRPPEAVDQLYDYYEITAYVIFTRKEMKAEFQREALQTDAELVPGEERPGLVFFEIPEEVDRFAPPGQLTLRLERLRWPRSGQDKTVELPLGR